MSRTTDAGDAPRGPSRRILLRTGFTAVVAAGTAAVLIPLHDHRQDTAPPLHRAPATLPPGPPGPRSSPRCTGAGRSAAA